MDALDAVNLRMIEELQQRGRASITDLARLLRRGESTVRDRLQSLERHGVIRGYQAVVDYDRIGYGMRAIARMDVNPKETQTLNTTLAAIPNVVSAAFVSGPKALRVELVAHDTVDLTQIVDRKLAPLAVGGVEIVILLKEVVRRRPAPPRPPRVAILAGSAPAATTPNNYANPTPPPPEEREPSMPGGLPFPPSGRLSSNGHEDMEEIRASSLRPGRLG